MPIVPKNFDRDLKAFEAEFETDVRRVIVTLDQAIVSGTPVDTGRARANWFMDFGSVSDRLTSSLGAPNTGRGNAWKSGDGNVFIHNSVDYIIYLDAGSSAQAPQGIVDPAIAAVRARFG